MYFLTITVVGWIDVFSRQSYRDIVIDSLKYCHHSKGLNIYAYVIMSNHLHMIVQSPEGKLSAIIRDFKKFTSRQIMKSIIENPKESRSVWMLKLFRYFAKFNKKNENYQFWKKDNRPIELFNPKWINQKINYIHQNPVQAGIVDQPEHYIYSSARDYLGRKGILDVGIIDVDSDANYIVGL